MIELSPQEVQGLITFHKAKALLYAYTPLCGTCKVATRMLEVVEEALPDLEIYKCNMNHAPEIAKRLQIQSVPCLLLFSKGQAIDRVYAFESVHRIYHTVNDWL